MVLSGGSKNGITFNLWFKLLHKLNNLIHFDKYTLKL